MQRVEVGGVSLEVAIAGDGAPLLFLHGGDYFAQNRVFLERLARRWRVFAPRHPGFGGSERPDGFRNHHPAELSRSADTCRLDSYSRQQ